MSSLLAYGQGFLAEDIGSGAGLTEPWAQSFGWGNVDESSTDQGTDGARAPGGGGGLSQFFSLIQEAAPPEPKDPDKSPKVLVRTSTKKDLHWDSPPQSPSTAFVHLPYAVLSIISTGTKADAVVVGVFQNGSESIVETLLHLPRGLKFGEYLVFKPDLLNCMNGKLNFLENINIPSEFINAIEGRPQAFVGRMFCLEKYKAVIFGLWRNASCVPATAEAIFSDAVQSLPMLLSNRINARRYERLGRRFDAILKVMPDAVLFIDDKCVQVTINPAAANLLGLPNHGEVDPSRVADAMQALTDRFKNRTDPQRWMRLLGTDNDKEIEEDWELQMPRCVLHVRSYPVTSHAAHGRLWIYEDVTAERDAEQAIEAANKAKSQFLAMMSHELRTPMTGVLGMLDLLHLTDLEIEQQGLVQIMEESAEGLMDVINNILDFCKIEAGRLMLEEIDFALADVLEQTETMLKKSFLKKDLKVKISGDPFGKNLVRGDPVRLRQVLLNLIGNAIKFTDHGSIDISWRILDPQWVDTTIVAMSQASSGKSKLINQIINNSRGEKCSVEHRTTASGRSIIVVNCSSAGTAGPYLESSVTADKSPVPSLLYPTSHQGQPGSDSFVDSSATETLEGTSRTSFPVSYAHQTLKRRLSETFQNAEALYSFTERKSITPNDSVRGTMHIGTASQLSGTVTREDQTTSLLKNANINPNSSPTSSSQEKGLQAPKYQRLSIKRPESILNIFPAVDQNLPGNPDDEILGLNRNPKWLSGLHAHAVQSIHQLHSNPLRSRGSTDANSLEGVAGKQKASWGHPQSKFTMTSNDNVDTDGGVARRDARAANSAEFQAHQSVKCDKSKEGPTKNELKAADKVWLEVTISDTGVGIGKEQLDRLFVGSHAGSQRRNATGTGLGLAICKGLLCLMNGKIQMDSKIGDGTTVTVTVPLLPPEESVKALVESASSQRTQDLSIEKQPDLTKVQLSDSSVLQPSESSQVPLMASSPGESTIAKPPVTSTKPENRKVKVLVAEDNRVNQLLIRKMFKHFGHEVEVVGNGKLAVEAVQKTVFDLILMDVQMPILDGLSATKAIRCLPPPVSQIPIYALSADNPGSGPLEETGLDGYLKKPIVWDMISQKVAEILSHKS